MSIKFTFKSLTKNDLQLLFNWLSLSHVSAWWHESKDWHIFKEKYNKKLINTNIGSFIIQDKTKSMGYIQWYKIADESILPAPYPENTFGIDLFIADVEYIGKGFAPIVIKRFIKQELLPKNPNKIIVDPEINNHRAIRTYEKVGFKKTKIIPTSNETSKVTTQLMELDPYEFSDL